MPLLALVSADLLTKVAAYRLLASAQEVNEDAPLQLVLRINFTGFGVWATTSLANRSGDELARSGGGYLAVAVYVVLTRRRNWSLLRKLATGLAVFLAMVMLCGAAQHFAGHLSRPAGALVAKIGGVTFFLALWWVAEGRALKASSMFLAAAALGNTLCLVVPPHGIVDFIYSAPLARLLGHGVLNLADLYFDVGAIGLLAVVARSLARSLIRRLSRVVDWLRG